ncbi:MAG: histidine phosphatase family protein [Cyanobacteriota bacterium]|jgi:phosphohistidine phosphatase|nr:histidine phosphatase family protein [Synechococcus sp. FGCU3]MEB3104301.1 histidine phosphatase family protein [Cyanobacteriota bacterium]
MAGVQELLLFRHGIAEERGGPTPEPLRALTPAGIRRTTAVAERLALLGIRADQLISSPLVRARQTAEIAVAAGLAGQLEIDGALAPDGDALALVRSSGAERLMLVGHEPDLGQLACQVLGAPAGTVTLKKAGLAVIVLQPTPSLRLLLAPKVLLAAASATARS